MRQLQLFTSAQLAVMRDRTASHSYSPQGEIFRREHARHRAWGLTRRHAEKLARLRPTGPASKPAAMSNAPAPQAEKLARPRPTGPASKPAAMSNMPAPQAEKLARPRPTGPASKPAAMSNMPAPQAEKLARPRPTGPASKPAAMSNMPAPQAEKLARPRPTGPASKPAAMSNMPAPQAEKLARPRPTGPASKPAAMSNAPAPQAASAQPTSPRPGGHGGHRTPGACSNVVPQPLLSSQPPASPPSPSPRSTAARPTATPLNGATRRPTSAAPEPTMAHQPNSNAGCRGEGLAALPYSTHPASKPPLLRMLPLSLRPSPRTGETTAAAKNRYSPRRITPCRIVTSETPRSSACGSRPRSSGHAHIRPSQHGDRRLPNHLLPPDLAGVPLQRSSTVTPIPTRAVCGTRVPRRSKNKAHRLRPARRDSAAISAHDTLPSRRAHRRNPKRTEHRAPSKHRCVPTTATDDGLSRTAGSAGTAGSGRAAGRGGLRGRGPPGRRAGTWRERLGRRGGASGRSLRRSPVRPGGRWCRRSGRGFRKASTTRGPR